MKMLKEAGLDEIRSLKKRALRQHAMGRIGDAARDTIVNGCNSIEAFIIEMEEEDPADKERW